MSEIVTQGIGVIDATEVAARGANLTALMEAARQWGCDEALNALLEQESPTEIRTRFAFAVLEEVEARADVDGPRWVAEPKATMREVLSEARARLEAKPDDR